MERQYRQKYAIYFKLNNQNSFLVDSYRCGEAVKLLNRTIPDKSAEQVRIKEGREKKWKWKNPFSKN